MSYSVSFSSLIPGNLSKITKKSGDFYHLTWKIDQKTQTRYIRLDEVAKVKKGIIAYKKAKAAIDKAAYTNLNLLFAKRKA